ncbi:MULTISPECIES: MerR family transcriptional regulator [Methylobacterium]|uniref:MerR family transcriptional regulator n=1 Tax=Methylobacterium TaxID=407 RepID=UPI001EDF68F6|nr:MULTISPECIES: MerR family transcriptional regulator [Methylobacterium]
MAGTASGELGPCPPPTSCAKVHGLGSGRGLRVTISIGELSRRSGVRIPTIRYYEQNRLISAPARTEGQQRRYTEEDVVRLSFVRQARELGLEVDAIRELLELGTGHSGSPEEAARLALRHRDETDRRIALLTALRSELGRLVAEYGRGRLHGGRLLEVLAQPDIADGER